MNKPRDASVASVIETCVAHLREQELLLDQLLGAARLVRHGLSRREYDGLREPLETIEELGQPMRVLHDQRASIRNEISRILGIPFQQATVRSLMQSATPSDRRRLETLREGTERLANEINQCNRGNAIWIRKSLEYYGWIFHALSVSKSVGNRYAVDGQLHKPASRPIVQVKG